MVGENNNITIIKRYSLRYIQEITEAFIAYSLYIYLYKKQFDIKENFKISLILGLVTLIIEEYNPSYKDAAKNAIIVALISAILKAESHNK